MPEPTEAQVKKQLEEAQQALDERAKFMREHDINPDEGLDYQPDEEGIAEHIIPPEHQGSPEEARRELEGE